MLRPMLEKNKNRQKGLRENGYGRTIQVVQNGQKEKSVI
jgi:hypothetical protein